MFDVHRTACVGGEDWAEQQHADFAGERVSSRSHAFHNNVVHRPSDHFGLVVDLKLNRMPVERSKMSEPDDL